MAFIATCVNLRAISRMVHVTVLICVQRETGLQIEVV